MSERVGGIYYDVEFNTSKMVDGQRRVQRELDGLSTKLTFAAAAVAGLAAALTALRITKLADEISMLAARVDVAAGSVENGTAAFAELVNISRRTQSSLAGNIEVFNRLNQSILQMGGTQGDTLRMTELLGKAIRVSGASATESKAAMLQFGQALGSGKLAGDELRSLLETAPYLMRQLADGIGVPVGALKQLGEDGKLTADVVTDALTRAAAKIDEDFKKLPQTFEAAMTVAQDSAALAATKLDELTGTSAALTGVTKGLGEVLDKLAEQFGAANSAAGALGRNEAISAWARTTRTVLSYVADAADVVWQTLSVLGRNVAFVFQGIGSEIGGIGAQIAAVMRGDFAGAKAIGDAMKADADQRRRDLDAKDAETLRDRKLAGQQMRDAWEQGAGGGRGFVNPDQVNAGGGKLKGSGGGKDDGKKKREPRDFIGDAEDRVKRLIEDWWYRNENALDKAEQDAAEKLARDQAKGRELAQQTIMGADPVAKLQAELQAKSDLLAEYAAIDQDNLELYAEARVRLEEEAARRIREIEERTEAERQAAMMVTLQNYGALFGNIAELIAAFGGKQSSAYRAMFAVSKAFSIAQSIIAIQTGIAQAAANPFPKNLIAMATVASATAGIVSTIQGVQFGGGRQYGGPVTAGSLYRVNEGGRPEMFTAANGAQYMLPTSGGNVTPAGGGAVQWKVIVNEAPPGTTARVDETARIVEIAVGRAKAEIATEISENSGQVWGALRGSTNVQGRF